MTDVPHLRLDSEHEVDIDGIYVENHDNEYQEFLIWIQFDDRKSGENESLPLLPEDPLISRLLGALILQRRKGAKHSPPEEIT